MHAREGACARRAGRAGALDARASRGPGTSFTRSRWTPLELRRALQLPAACSTIRRSATAIWVTAVFVLIAVPARAGARASCWRCFSTSSLFAPPGPAHHHDPADLRHPARGRLSVLHHLLRGGRPARLHSASRSCRTRAGRCSRSSWSTSGSGRRSASSCSSPRCRACPTSSTRRRGSMAPRTSTCCCRVLLPLLQPTILIVLLLRLAEALKLFDIPFALTGGGPGIATQSYSVPRLPRRPALLRPRLRQRHGLRAADRGHDHRDPVLPPPARDLWLTRRHRRRAGRSAAHRALALRGLARWSRS